MNKDVIYIEPEDDITDILANVKSAKNKIVALVPPKKAGVLRSAVNFKLIAKTARQSSKIVVLITTDESLLKLAENVKMPTARSLQSKPKLPANLDASEFGISDDEDDFDSDEEDEDEDKDKDKDLDDDVIEEEPKKNDAKKEVTAKDDVKKAATVRHDIDMELDDDDLDDREGKKPAKKKKSTKSIPDFRKVRLPIIIAVVVFILIFGFIFWALNIAPAAKISVKVSTSSQNFSENVSFTTDEKNAKPEEGIFLLEQKSITKTAEAEFSATGEVDKGAKASGTITLKATSPVLVGLDMAKTINIPAGSSFSYNGMSYISSTAATISITKSNFSGLDNCDIFSEALKCDLSSDATATINVVAAENGDKYNISETNSGWSSSITGATVASSSAMTGGTSKKIKVVSQKDVETAEAGLESEGESDARKKLIGEFGDTYLLIENSFSASSGKISSSPAINEEVKDGVKPKVIKEIKYIIFAVERDQVNKYIKAKTNTGDDTQTIYSTGIADKASDDDKGRIESFKKDKETYTGKLKTVVKTGPRVTESMISEKSLGKKIGEVQSQLKSIKGISDVKIDSSYFWVTSVPSDPNKVSFEITVE